MQRETRTSGYLRTSCWSKIKHLFENMPVTKLRAARSKQQKGDRDEIHPWLYADITGKGKIVMDWDLQKHRISWDIAVRDFTNLQNKYLFEDFVVEKIEIIIKDGQLINMINALIKEKKKDIKPFSEENNIYITYENEPLAYHVPNGISPDVIRQINSIQIKEMGFKLGVMGLNHIRIKNQINPSIDFVLENREINWHIIKYHVNNERWFKLPEIKKLATKTYPGSVRTYESGEKMGWKLIKDEEIK